MERKRDINRKNKEKAAKLLKTDTLTVQLLSTNVSGKAQKYSRRGPREFVPYQKEDLTFDGIRLACQSYFASKMEQDQLIDILAGDQGPSCLSLQQIPDLKLVHIRFVSKPDSDVEDDDAMFAIPTFKRRKVSNKPANKKEFVFSKPSLSQAKSSQMPTTLETNSFRPGPPSSMINAYPKSLSTLDMMKLGKVVKQPKSLKAIEIFKFNIKGMIWTTIPDRVEFSVESEAFGEGGFRKAVKARSMPNEYKGTWVVKRYLPGTLSTIEKLGQTVEDHTRKVVQMHALAKHFTDSLAARVKDVCKDDFGKSPWLL